MVVTIKVMPRSGKQQCQLDKAGTIKCYLKSPPEQGKANEELVKMLAKALDVPQAKITILAGATGRTKMIKIDAVFTHDQLLNALGIERQLVLK